MQTVIDANIVAGYYKGDVLGIETDLTAEAKYVIDRLGSEDQVFLDEDGHIEHEWRGPIDHEWFEVWYGDQLINGGAVCIPVNTCQDLRRTLTINFGFPASKDIWYLRTAKAVLATYKDVVLITEDIDFYDPTEKNNGGDRRTDIIETGAGKLCRHLRKKEKIAVECVARYKLRWEV